MRKSRVGGGEVGFERFGRGRGRKTVGKEKEDGKRGWNGERIQLRLSGREEKFRKREKREVNKKRG